jgi:uncharacterized caspase-like protein/outer membrane protein assembly factor BamD (BamD/ComL family)
MGRRLALIIGNSIFMDPSLARLRAPDADVGALADVLLSPEIGAFDDAKLVVNMAASSIRRAISQFVANKTRDDLLLLYFSGHGVLDEYGRLYLATKDTERNYLRGTAIPAGFITDEMDHSRSRRQVLVLDCCHSGAFARGSKGSTGASVGTATAFEGKGYGRVVLTASDATQYAWEGDKVIGEADNSVFTHYLIEGLETGQADADGDGKITVDELYDYIYKQVVTQTPKQTPGKWSYREQGEIIIAQAPAQVAPKAEELHLPEFDDEIEDKLKRLFDSGLAAYWLEEWERATQAFQAIIEARPEYPGVAEKLYEARRQAELADLYEKAQSALESEDWDSATAEFEAVVSQASDYRDAASQLAFAQERKHLAELYTQASSLVKAEKWQAAHRVLSKIEESAPDYPDENGLKLLIEENLARLERQRKIDSLYRQVLKEIDSEELDAARQSLTQLQEIQPGYAESERLLSKVEIEIQRKAEERQRQDQIDAFYRQAQDLARAEQWPEVLAKMEEIQSLDPDFADPEGLAAKAEEKAAKEEEEARHQSEVAALYAEAVRLLKSGQYQGALEKWKEVQDRDPWYPDRQKVKAKASKNLEALAKGVPPRRIFPRWAVVAFGGFALVAIVVIAVIGGQVPGGEAPKATSTVAAIVATGTAEPTNIPRPPTPTSVNRLPPPVSDVLPNVQALYHDDFDQLLASDWQYDSNYVKVSAGQLEIPPPDPTGPVGSSAIHRMHRILQEGEGVLILFKYDDPDANFNISLLNGLWGKPEFREWSLWKSQESFYLYVEKGTAGPDVKPLIGNLTPRQDIWYYLLLAVEENGKLVAQVWERDDPDQISAYRQSPDEDWVDVEWWFGVFPGGDRGKVFFDTFTEISFSSYDDFDNPSYDTRIDASNWHAEGSHCSVKQDDGKLVFDRSSKTVTEDSGCFLKTIGDRLGKYLELFEADVKMVEWPGEGETALLLVHSSKAGWIECGISSGSSYTNVRLAVGTSKWEEFGTIDIANPERWNTIRVEIDPDTMTFSCYFNNEKVGSIVPDFGQDLHRLEFERYLQYYFTPEAWAKFYVDDVRLAP